MSLIYTSPASRHNLYLGGKADAKSLITLQQRNVKRILNVTPAKEAGITAGVPNFFENKSSSGIKYKRISVYDTTMSDLLPYADEMVQFISNGLHHGSVLVHCQRGVSRSGTAVIMFLMRKANMTLNQSLKLCQRRRPTVDPNPAFLDQLRTFERECRQGGHLTSVENEQDNSKANGKECDNEMVGSARGNLVHAAGVEKRKSENIGDRVGPKKRAAGQIGPGGVGPKKRAVGPIGAPRRPVKSAVIGPARRPPKIASIEKFDSEPIGDGTKPKGANGDAEAKKEKWG